MCCALYVVAVTECRALYVYDEWSHTCLIRLSLDLLGMRLNYSHIINDRLRPTRPDRLHCSVAACYELCLDALPWTLLHEAKLHDANTSYRPACPARYCQLCYSCCKKDFSDISRLYSSQFWAFIRDKIVAEEIGVHSHKSTKSQPKSTLFETCSRPSPPRLDAII